MQAGTEFAMESCSRLGFARVRSSLYETPLTKVRVSLGEVNPLLGERFEGVRSSFLAVVPFSCGCKTQIKVRIVTELKLRSLPCLPQN